MKPHPLALLGLAILAVLPLFSQQPAPAPTEYGLVQGVTENDLTV